MKAVELIEVEYEELEAVFDAEYGASDKAPLIHPNLGEYIYPNFIFPKSGNQHLQSFQDPAKVMLRKPGENVPIS